MQTLKKCWQLLFLGEIRRPQRRPFFFFFPLQLRFSFLSRFTLGDCRSGVGKRERKLKMAKSWPLKPNKFLFKTFLSFFCCGKKPIPSHQIDVLPPLERTKNGQKFLGDCAKERQGKKRVGWSERPFLPKLFLFNGRSDFVLSPFTFFPRSRAWLFYVSTTWFSLPKCRFAR